MLEIRFSRFENNGWYDVFEKAIGQGWFWGRPKLWFWIFHAADNFCFWQKFQTKCHNRRQIMLREWHNRRPRRVFLQKDGRIWKILGQWKERINWKLDLHVAPSKHKQRFFPQLDLKIQHSRPNYSKRPRDRFVLYVSQAQIDLNNI